MGLWGLELWNTRTPPQFTLGSDWLPGVFNYD